MNTVKLALLVMAAGGLAVACGSSGSGSGNTGGASGAGGAAGAGGASSAGAGGAMGGAAGAAGAAGATGGTGGDNPVCAGADSHGFFNSCSACTDPSNCDTIDVSGSSRNACGCNGASDCPCGLRCGCYEIAPNVNTCGICVR